MAEASEVSKVRSVGEEDVTMGCAGKGNDAAEVDTSIGAGEVEVKGGVVGAEEPACRTSEWEVDGADVSMASSSDNNEHSEETAGSRLSESELSRGFPVVSGSDGGGGSGLRQNPYHYSQDIIFNL